MFLIFLYAANVYLTYYTWRFARSVWRSGNKPGGIATGVLAVSLLPLTYIGMLYK